MMMSDCERSQVNYETPTPADRWIFVYTGNEIAWWPLGALSTMSSSNNSVDLADR